METHASQLLDLAKSRGLITAHDLGVAGIPRVSLTRAVRRGQLDRIGRGVYGLPGRPVTEHSTFAEVSLRVPKGVVCPCGLMMVMVSPTSAPRFSASRAPMATLPASG